MDLQEAIRTDPERYLRVLGEHFRGREHSDEAIAMHRQVVAAQPRLAKGHHALARLYDERGSYQEALGSYDRALELAPDMAEAHYDRANLLYRYGHEKQAILGYRRAIAADPKFRDAHFHLGNVLSKQGALLDGAAAYQTAVQCDPEFVDGLVSLGNNLCRLGRLNGAKEVLAKALQIDPDLPKAELCLGLIAKQTGQMPQALAHFRRAIALDPKLAAPWSERALVYLLRGETDEAIAAARRCVAIDPHYHQGHIILSTALARAGREAEANQVSIEAVRIRPSRLRPFKGQDPIGSVLVLKCIETGYFRLGPGNRIIISNAGVNNAAAHFDQSKFRRCSLYVDGFASAADIDRLPECDVVFNEIADADSAQRTLEIAQSVVEKASVPVLNPPDLILRTPRHVNYQRLNELEGIVFPRTITLQERMGSRQEISKKLDDAELSFPLLARRIGTHTGQSLEKVDNVEQLEAYFSKHPEGSYYLIEFVDFFDPRGAYIKMRGYFVGGVFHPNHFFVSDDWNVHSSDEMLDVMEANEWMLGSAKRFCADPEDYLGREAFRALNSVCEKLPLDYFGIDFTQLQDGSILIFEANAAMRLGLRDSDRLKRQPFRKPCVQAIEQSLDQMLEKKIRDAQRQPK